jgi:DNA modification methylase
MIIEKKKISDLIPAPYNPRQSTAKQEKHLKESLEKFGLVEPIIFNKQTGWIVGGHFRVRELIKLGVKEVECVIVDLNEDDEMELNIRLNANTGSWDWDTLANDWEVVDLEAWGLEIPQFGNVEELEASEDDYEVPEGGMETDIVIGDLFEIGEHRLLCGDSTDSDAVARLMNGEKADMVFTDPPYGVSYQSNMRTKTEKFDVLQNDNVFITEWINSVTLFSNGFVFVWTNWKVLSEWIEICKPIGVLSNMIIWMKGSGSMGDLTKTFATDFEIALVYNRGNDIKGKRIGSVWSVGKEMIYNYDFKVPVYDYLHPTQKPIKLAEQAIQNVSIINNLVLDFFLGSGSTMVAAHQLKRRCYGMELEPKYCQVIIDRMRKLDSSLIIKRNGIEIKQV